MRLASSEPNKKSSTAYSMHTSTRSSKHSEQDSLSTQSLQPIVSTATNSSTEKGGVVEARIVNQSTMKTFTLNQLPEYNEFANVFNKDNKSKNVELFSGFISELNKLECSNAVPMRNQADKKLTDVVANEQIKRYFGRDTGEKTVNDIRGIILRLIPKIVGI